MRRWSFATAAVLVAVTVSASPAQATFPGENGKIAFTRGSGCFDRTVHAINPDGTDETQLTASGENGWGPTWSPDGTRIAFNAYPPGESCLHPQIYVMNADGTGRTRLTFNAHADDSPTWSPDGAKIAFIREGPPQGECNVKPRDIWTMNADGTSLTQVTTGPGSMRSDPAWSPDGDWIVYTFRSITHDPEDFCTPSSPGDQLLVRNVDSGVTYELDTVLRGPQWSPDSKKYVAHGGHQGDVFIVKAPFGPQVDGDTQQITNTPSVAEYAGALSPDNSKLAYNSSPPQAKLIVANSDGSGATEIAIGAVGPNWQPVQRPHARPKGATPFRVSLVPAMKPCTAPNREHGPPLAFPSCNPPQPESPNLTVSQGDARLRSVGSVRMDVLAGAPGAPDDTDVQIRFSLTNVMQASDFADYTGSLTASIGVRLTDRDAGQSSTTQDFPLSYAVPCATTADTFLGSTCASTTSLDAVVPGAAAEGSRAIWALDRLAVYDEQGFLFATQGVFVP